MKKHVALYRELDECIFEEANMTWFGSLVWSEIDGVGYYTVVPLLGVIDLKAYQFLNKH
jgi:hypothetical protein